MWQIIMRVELIAYEHELINMPKLKEDMVGLDCSKMFSITNRESLSTHIFCISSKKDGANADKINKNI